MTRLTSRFLVNLILRRTQAAGGFAAVLVRGDETSGIILIQCSDRGQPGPLLERRFAADGHYVWEQVGPAGSDDGESYKNYQDRRRSADPDLWIVELDIADAPRLVAEWGALT